MLLTHAQVFSQTLVHRNGKIELLLFSININIKKGWQQDWERAINTLSVRRPQPHNTNP